MAVFNEPTQWATSLVVNGDTNVIPQSTPAGSGALSFDDGFPQITQVPLGAGGIAPDRKDFNAVMKLLGDAVFYMQNGGFWSYNPLFDYAVGRVVLYTDGNLYKCIQANSALDPKAPTDSDYWSKMPTLAEVAGSFADKGFSNINNNARSEIAHNSVPSYIYDELTIGASGTSYTSPTDGYVSLTMKSTAIGQYCMINNGGFLLPTFSAPQANTDMRLFVPVQKGVNFKITYNCPTTSSILLFVYLNGTKHEKA